MVPNFNVGKMHSTVEKRDDCEYSLKIIISLKEHMAGIKCFGNKHATGERIDLAMHNSTFSCQNKYSTLQGMDDCHSFCDKKRYTTSRDGWLQLEW